MSIRALLPKYHDILEENGTARYRDCKQVPVEFDPSLTTAELHSIF